MLFIRIPKEEDAVVLAPKPNTDPLAVVAAAPKPVPKLDVPNNLLDVFPTWLAPKAPNAVPVLDGVPKVNPPPAEG